MIKENRKMKEIICLECGRKWSIRADRDNSGYCRQCLTKGIRNPMYGKIPYNKGQITYNRNKFAKERKKEIVSMFGNKCHVCGNVNLPVSNYEFHHIDKTKKEKTISQMILWKWDKIKLELEKCIMVCANCHKTIHFGDEKLV